MHDRNFFQLWTLSINQKAPKRFCKQLTDDNWKYQVAGIHLEEDRGDGGVVEDAACTSATHLLSTVPFSAMG